MMIKYTIILSFNLPIIIMRRYFKSLVNSNKNEVENRHKRFCMPVSDSNLYPFLLKCSKTLGKTYNIFSFVLIESENHN